jgi:GNAT superfamily N-acetyltransferase
MIQFRSLKPGEEKEAYDIIEKGYELATMPHFRWRFTDNPSWNYDYSAIGETEGRITTIAFLEPQTVKFLDGTLSMLVAGAGVVHPDYRGRGYYKMMTNYIMNKAREMGRTVFAVYVLKDRFTYSVLKKYGFFPLHLQHQYIKVLNMRNAFLMATHVLNTISLPEDLCLNMKIVPKSEDPFVLRLENGKSSIGEDTEDFDFRLSGDIEKIVQPLLRRDLLQIIFLFLRRVVKLRVKLSSLKKLVKLAKIMVIS